MDPKVQKQLKINVGAVKRIVKDKQLAQSDLEKATKDLNETKFERSSFEYKNLVNLKQEAEAMIVDADKRLDSFKTKLRASLAPAEGFPDDPLVIEAKQFLQ
jgi:hypothetical protein